MVIVAFFIVIINYPAKKKAALNPEKVINEYGAFIENHPPSPLRIEDISVLPYPKDIILSALLNAMSPGQKEKNDFLHGGAIFLAQYQPGVGSEPLYQGGFDLNEFLLQRPTTKDPEAVRAKMKEMQVAIERGKKTAARFEEFNKLVAEDLRQIGVKFTAAITALNE